MLWLLAAILLLPFAHTAAAPEEGRSPADSSAPAPQPQSSPAQPPAVNKPSFLHELGRWWDDSVANFNAGMKDAQGKLNDFNAQANEAAKDAAAATQEAMKNAADAAKEAATAVVRLPNTRVIEIREPCTGTLDGAPDCRAAATTACRGNGFNTGQALDIRSAQKCPARIWLSRRPPSEGDCRVETVVTRAVCQ
jgi:hypothetical protein